MFFLHDHSDGKQTQLRKQGDERVLSYAIMAAFYHLQPKVDVLQKNQSGGDNKKWIEARFNMTK